MNGAELRSCPVLVIVRLSGFQSQVAMEYVSKIGVACGKGSEN
jgi:hypothetical protein